MSVDWTTVATNVCEKVERGEANDLHKPEWASLLADMEDCAPDEFARVCDALKRARAATAVLKSVRRNRMPSPRGCVMIDDAAAGERPLVELTYDRMAVRDKVVEHLGQRPDVFVQGALLVTVVPQSEGRAPIVRAISRATLHAMVTATLTLYTRYETKFGEVREPKQPDATLLDACLQLGWDPRVRTLRGVTTAPIPRVDGSHHAARGYDDVSGYLCGYNGPALAVPAAPTREDALDALTCILEMLDDFPFKNESHRSAWLALLFTLLLRPMLRGNVLIFLVSATSPGTGKTMLADLASLIIFGETLARRAYTDDTRELNATVTAILAEGSVAALFDNADTAFGGAIIDLITTGSRFKARLYGSNNQSLDLDARTVFVVTGNNLSVRGDAARRALYIELEAKEERPELRSGFRFPDLLGTATARRGEFLTALLTIHRAFIVAGCPRTNVPPLGSFNEWESWVRAPLLWLGLADPVETQERLREEQDAVLIALLDAWEQMFGLNQPVPLTEAIDAILKSEKHIRAIERGEYASNHGGSNQMERKEAQAHARHAQALKAALKELGLVSLENPSLSGIGRKFKQFANRRCHGRMFVNTTRSHTNAWQVVVPEDTEGQR